MENQVNEIMRSLGRIEQKTDSAIDSLNAFKGDIKDALKDQNKRLLTLETKEASSEGKSGMLTMIWSGVISASITLLGAYYSRK